jgi:hypothetical protein
VRTLVTFTRRTCLIGAVLLALALGGVPQVAGAYSAPRHHEQLLARDWKTTTSTIWAGYVLHANSNYTLHSILTVFAVPRAHCSPHENSLADVWAGLGGATKAASLVQGGIAVGCRDGIPGYDAWAEWYDEKKGNHEVVQKGLKVVPGDNMTVDIYELSPQRYRVALQQTAQGNEYPTGGAGITLSDPGGSPLGNTAECVVERPELAGGGFQPLTDYGTVRFSPCEATDQRNIYESSTTEAVDVVSGVQYNISNPETDQALPALFETYKTVLSYGGFVATRSAYSPLNDNPRSDFWVAVEAWTHH